MRARRSTTLTLVAIATLALGACGSPGSGGGEADPTSSGTSGLATCDPIAGDKLVVLEDDKGLQNADNIIPAVNKAAADANPAVIELLDTVSAALDTDKLIELNKAVDIDRRTSSEVAEEFVSTEGLAAEDGAVGAGAPLVIGAANFSESATLAEIYAAVLRTGGFTVEVRTIGNRETYLPAAGGRHAHRGPGVRGDARGLPQRAAERRRRRVGRVAGRRRDRGRPDPARRGRRPDGRRGVRRAGPERVRRDQRVRGGARPHDAQRPRRQLRWSGPGRSGRVPRAPVLPARVSRTRTASSSPTSSRTTSA